MKKNISVDILNEPSNSDKEVNWICSNCGNEYVDKVNNHSKYHCPKCGNEKLYEGLSGYKRKVFWYQFRSYVWAIILSLLTSFIQYGVTFKWEIVTNDLIITILFCVIVLLELVNICFILEKIKLNKDKYLIKVRFTLYNLFKNCNDFNTLKEKYYQTIEDRLIFLINRKNENSNKEIIIEMLRREKIKECNLWVNNSDMSEFKALLSIYRNDSYFYKLYSNYETKQLIDYSNDINLKTLSISIIITIISLFLSIYPTINDWNLFIRKVSFLIVPIVVIVLTMLFNYKKQKSISINNYKFDTIYISSAVAKINSKH